MIQNIRSRGAEFQKFQVLKTNRNKRHRYREFFVEGVRNLNQAVENGWEVSSLLFPSDRKLSGWAEAMLSSVNTQVNYRMPGQLLDELSGKEDGSELMAVVKMRTGGLSRLDKPACPLWVLFDRPSNRGNLGTLLRSCDGFGAHGLILTGHGVDLYDPEVVTASMGSFFRVPAFQEENTEVQKFIAAMRQEYPGFRILGTTAHQEFPVFREDLRGPVLLMLGNETEGLSYGFKQSCDRLVTIPMAAGSSASSFNVACAGTVLLYEAMRQRGTPKV